MTELDDGYDQITRNIKDLAANPSAIPDHMESRVGNLSAALPNIAQSIHTQGVAALSYLNSKIPKPSNTLLGDAEYEPSDAEKSQFMDHYSAVNDPVSILDHVKNGTITSGHIEALTAVHPELLGQMRQEVAGELKNQDIDKLPYVTKMSVAKFLGQPVDSSMTPKAIMANQLSLAGPQLGNQVAQPTGRRARPAMLSKAKFSDRAATQTTDLESDKD